MTSLPSPLSLDEALFLDFDGTLVDIADRPDAVVVDPELPSLLGRLFARQQQAVAIISGRTLAEIDHWLRPLQLPAAGEHGAQWRDVNGRLDAREASSQLGAVAEAAQALGSQHPRLLVEWKHGGLALHYRAAPELESLCLQTLEAALAETPGFELLRGKCVAEIKAKGVSKGAAIDRFLTTDPFAGRRPVFIGDDVTDEAGFTAVLARGGRAIKVGPGDSQAPLRLANPAAVRDWLAHSSR